MDNPETARSLSVSAVRVRAYSCDAHSDFITERRLMAKIERFSEEATHVEEHDKNSHNSKKVIFMILVTVLFFFVELVVGLLNRSIALLADSYHMLSDVMALVIALICLRLARKGPKKNNAFGWLRAEVLGALVNGVFLLAMCFTLTIESISRLINPRNISNPIFVLIVGAVGLFINLIGIALFHGSHGHSHGGHDKKKHKVTPKTTENSEKPPATVTFHLDDNEKEDSGIEHQNSITAGSPIPTSRSAKSLSHMTSEVSHGASSFSLANFGSNSMHHLALRLVNLDDSLTEDDSDIEHLKKMEDAQNLNMRGVFLHIISDAIGSVIVIITAGLALCLPSSMDRVTMYLDPGLSLCLVALISISAFRLVNETSQIVLGKPPSFLNFEYLKKDLGKIRGVAKVVEVSVWTLVANRHIATATIEFCNPLAFDSASPKIRKYFHRIGIHSLTMKPSFSSSACRSQSVSYSSTPLSSPQSTSSEEVPSEHLLKAQ